MVRDDVVVSRLAMLNHMTMALKLRSWFSRHWIELVSVIVGSWFIHCYRWLLDDAFIYFRYVDNWLFLDRGLVYNEGEYVEGFSSQLWPLIIGLPRACRVSYWAIVEGVGLLVGLVFFILVMRIGTLMSPSTGTRINAPLVFLAVSYGPATYFTGGLETPLVQLAAPLVALFVLEPERPWSVMGLAFAPVIRPELLLPVAVAVVAVRVRTGRWPMFPIVMTASVGLVAVGLRIWLYADLFPNTYYLKDTADWGRGLAYLWDTLRGAQLHIVIPLVVGVEWWVTRTLGPPPEAIRSARRWLLLIALASTVYVVRIGGDMVHYRYLAFPVCLVVIAGAGCAERWATVSRTAATAVRIFVLMAGALVFGAHPHYLSGHPLSSRTTKIDGPHGVSEAIFHRRLPKQTYDVPRAEQEAAQLRSYAGLRGQSSLGQPVYRHRACVDGYLRMDAVMINNYGLTEPVLARGDAPELRAGHRNLSLAARDLQQLRHRRRRYGWGPGSFRAGVRAGVAPRWVEDNIEAIEQLEARVYNDHDMLDNLGLALTWPRIEFSDRVKNFRSGWK